MWRSKATRMKEIRLMIEVIQYVESSITSYLKTITVSRTNPEKKK